MNNHSDCTNFIPVDVAKGLCNLHNQEIMAPGDICSDFEETPKCKNCSHFTEPNEKGMGNCKGFADDFWTFGDLRTGNCENYLAKS